MHDQLHTAKQQELLRLQQLNYNDLPLSSNIRQSGVRTQAAAEKIYNDQWNYYSNALKAEVLHVFDCTLLHLASRFQQINYLEIGSAQGISMSVIGLTLQGLERCGKLVSLDPYFANGYVEGEGSPWKADKKITIDKATRDSAQVLYAGLGLKVTHLDMTSAKGLKKFVTGERQFQLIYIDGSHERLNPVIDFGLCCTILAPGGVIMLDDPMWDAVTPVKELCDLHAKKIAECWKVASYEMPPLEDAESIPGV